MSSSESKSAPTKLKRENAKSARHLAREQLVQALYQWCLVANADPLLILKQIEAREPLADWPEDLLAQEPAGTTVDHRYFREVWPMLVTAEPILAERLQPHLDRPYAELSPIERSILLLGAYELIHRLDIPYRVVLNEAIELAKNFGGTDGHKYVNGVLDRLVLTARSAELRKTDQKQ